MGDAAHGVSHMQASLHEYNIIYGGLDSASEWQFNFQHTAVIEAARIYSETYYILCQTVRVLDIWDLVRACALTLVVPWSSLCVESAQRGMLHLCSRHRNGRPPWPTCW